METPPSASSASARSSRDRRDSGRLHSDWVLTQVVDERIESMEPRPRWCLRNDASSRSLAATLPWESVRTSWGRPGLVDSGESDLERAAGKLAMVGLLGGVVPDRERASAAAAAADGWRLESASWSWCWRAVTVSRSAAAVFRL